ncbi:SipW-dependent-type signal peptide-containing protein [Hominifimenecus sp. rT4P-3]|uniref:SipW-dependent-type signal peptide-containing protein n=1 Tax=Hominifimenecus sp. rT4P-3 TaxID=3242979 RepID=UPI003DA668C9
MKTKSKALLLTFCAVLLTAASVLGTMAYLTSQDSATNTFTVGSVAITLDEQDVDNSTEGKDRDQANAYHLVPGHEYTKDPIIHVNAASEDCYVFVKVENGISAYEAAAEGGYKPISAQILANGWTALDGVANVYYKEYAKEQADKDLEVFENFKISDAANTVNGWSDINAENTQITIHGYAVQKDGFDTAKAAWDAAFGVSA